MQNDTHHKSVRNSVSREGTSEKYLFIIYIYIFIYTFSLNLLYRQNFDNY